jgi:hypothetical protein
MPGFGVFESKQPRKNSTPTEQDKLAAILLYNTCKKHRLCKSITDISKWANEFKLLRQQLDVSPIRLSKVLRWWTEHTLDRFTPRIYSAKSFRDKFIQIEAVMDRYEPKIKNVPIGPETIEILGRFGSLKWPAKETKKQEQLFVQLSFNAYKELHRKIYLLGETLENKKQKHNPDIDSQLLHYLYWHVLTPPDAFCHHWLINVHKIAWSWDKWDGHLLRFVFHPEQKAFVKWIQRRISDYNATSHWQTILIMLKDVE